MAKIYGLYDPTTQELRYVGQTIKKLSYRLNGHIQDSKRYSHYTANWIQSLLKKDLIPEIKMIELCKKENINSREIYWISYCNSIGAKLTNSNGGGQLGSCKQHTKEAKLKISNFMRQYKKSTSHINKMKATLTKPVYQYSNEGMYLKSYSSLEELKKYKYLKNTINSACRREGTAYGFNWRYYKQKKIKAKIPYFKNEEFSKKISETNRNRYKK